MQRRLYSIFSCTGVVLMLLALITGYCGCGKKKNAHIKLGFAGPLTGPLADFGAAGRDGVILAVEQANQSGGINGQTVELIVKDDQNSPSTALVVDRELILEHVPVIIGHMTGTLSRTALNIVNRQKTMLISPTTRTHALTGQDDHFISITPHSLPEAEALAQYAFKTLNIKNVTGVYDLSNRTYSEELYQNFKNQYEKLGGSLVFTTTFTSGQDVNYKDIAKILNPPTSQGILIIASPLDTGMICDAFKKIAPDVPVMSSAWGMGNDLIKYGGTAVEGVVASDIHDYESTRERYINFVNQFRTRFGYHPDYAACAGYEAAKMVLNVLPGVTDIEKLKKAITSQQIIPGLQENIRMDAFGDTDRSTRYLITVKNGKFKTLSAQKKKWY